MFVVFSTVWQPTLYQRTVGVVVPAWGQIPGVRFAVRKCGIKGCTVVPAERLQDPHVALRRRGDGGLYIPGGCCEPDLWQDADQEDRVVDALRILTLYRAQHLSWATALKMERRCTKEELYTTKQSLRPFHAIPMVVSTVAKRDRAAAKVSLKDVVYTIIQIAKAAIQLQVPADPIKVIVGTYAAPLWRSCATRADIFVDVWGGPQAAGNPALWGTWRAMDGADDMAYLPAMDYCGRLNEEIEGLQGGTHVGGLLRTMVVCPTPDGKGMQVINPRRGGNKCWVCRDDKSLDVCHTVPNTLRWGACY